MSTVVLPAGSGRAGIEALLPHSGDMCLVDEVLEWDERRIRCLSQQHRLASNPLRSDDRLGAIHGLEFAAQAAAVHAALVLRAAAGGGDHFARRGGRVAAFRGVRLHVDRLDTVEGALLIVATRTSAGNEAGGAAAMRRAEVYSVCVSATETEGTGFGVLVEARVTVAFVNPTGPSG